MRQTSLGISEKRKHNIWVVTEVVTTDGFNQCSLDSFFSPLCLLILLSIPTMFLYASSCCSLSWCSKAIHMMIEDVKVFWVFREIICFCFYFKKCDTWITLLFSWCAMLQVWFLYIMCMSCQKLEHHGHIQYYIRYLWWKLHCNDMCSVVALGLHSD